MAKAFCTVFTTHTRTVHGPRIVWPTVTCKNNTKLGPSSSCFTHNGISSSTEDNETALVLKCYSAGAMVEESEFKYILLFYFLKVCILY